MPGAIAGLVLAGGAGRRWGAGPGWGPKLLTADGEGTTLLEHAVRTLAEGGCDPVAVVVGAHADLLRGAIDRMITPGGVGAITVVDCPTWERGMGESLRAGLAALTALASHAEAVVVTLADLPDQTPQLVRRLLQADPRGSDTRARVVFGGRPGHPVLLGRGLWPEAADAAHDDVGARAVLSSPDTVVVECSDLADGSDVDRPGDLHSVPARWGASSVEGGR